MTNIINNDDTNNDDDDTDYEDTVDCLVRGRASGRLVGQIIRNK